MMKKHILSLSAMRKLLKKEGTKSVSLSACEKLRELLEIKASFLSKKAIKSALFHGRKVVRGKDLILNEEVKF